MNDVRTEHAFPSGDGPYGGGPCHDYGMTLRDWFAGQALAGLATLSRTSTRESMPEDMSILAYGIADAMLAERSRPKSAT